MVIDVTIPAFDDLNQLREQRMGDMYLEIHIKYMLGLRRDQDFSLRF
jgi:hypothetical protein